MQFPNIKVSTFEFILKWLQENDKFPSKYHENYLWSEPVELDYQSSFERPSFGCDRPYWSDPLDLDNEKVLIWPSNYLERTYDWSEPINLIVKETLEFPKIDFERTYDTYQSSN